jgi:CHAT domain-containing protein
LTTIEIPTVTHLRKNFLDDETALLSYHLSDSVITIFNITKGKADCIQKPLYGDFHSDVASLVNYLHSNATVDQNIYNRLYQFLIDRIPQKRLIIIPDDELNYLPFEVLKDGTGKYLIEDHTVQYHYSTALLNKEKEKWKPQSVIAFAPFAASSFRKNGFSFSQLRNSSSEINGWDSKTFLNTTATKQNFLNTLQQNDVIHFATHAAANDSNNNLSYIAFYPSGSDYLMYAQEIYNLPLKNTHLVILSACETGSGNLVRGEGVMSLSRAFAYAGCPNIITSLWKADDAATSYIIQRFQRYLKKGYSIDKAIQVAKKDFLKDDQVNPRMKDPAYWGHLVFIGNYTPAKNESIIWLIIAIAGIILLAILKKIKSRNSGTHRLSQEE